MTSCEKRELEKRVFLEFASVCNALQFVRHTARPGPDPPDVLCDLESGETLAFELVGCEDVTKDDSHPDGLVAVMPKKPKDSMALVDALRTAYDDAVAAGRIKSPERFEFHSVTVYFEDGTSCAVRQQAVPRVIEVLNQGGSGHHSVKDGVIRSVRCELDPEHLRIEGPPSFHIPSGCGARPYVVERIGAKLAKTYQSDHKIHLLAWSTTACHAESILWRDRLVDLLKSNGMGPFDRVWVFGYCDKSVVFDSAVSLA